MGWWVGDLVHYGIHVACQFRFYLPDTFQTLPVRLTLAFVLQLLVFVFGLLIACDATA
jgi:hypothetical protein